MRKTTYSTYSVSTGTPWLKWIGATFVFGAFAALMWFATSHKDALLRDDDDLELILPLSGPVKVRSREPSGMDVLDRDKQVFDLLDNSIVEPLPSETLCEHAEGALVCNRLLPKVTQLAATPEAVEKASEISRFKPRNADIALLIQGYEAVNPVPVKKVIVVKNDGIKTNEKRTKSELETKNSHILVKKTIKNEEKENQAKQTAHMPRGIEMIAKDKLYTGKAWGVQLASYKSLKNADRGAKILLKKYAEILKPLTYVTEKVDIPKKGRFYRIQFIGLKDKLSAQKSCAILKAKGQGCWYVSR